MKLLLLFVLFCFGCFGQEDSLLQNLRESANDTSKVNCYLDLFDYYYERDPLKAARYGEKARHLSERVHYNSGIYKSAEGLIVLNTNHGSIFEAIALGEDLLNHNSLPNVEERAYVYSLLGRAHAYNGDYEEAIKMDHKAVQLTNDEDFESRLLIISNLAAGYIRSNRFKKGIDLFKDIRAEYLIETDFDIFSGAYLALGYLKLNQLDSSKHYLNRASQQINELEEKEVELLYLDVLAQFEYEKGNFKEVVHIAEIILAKAKVLNHFRFNLIGLKLISKAFAGMGNFKQESLYLKKHFRFKDSIRKVNFNFGKKIMQINADLKDEQRTFEQREFEQQLSDAKVKNQLNLLVLLVILVTVVGSFIFFYFRNKRKSDRLITQQLRLEKKNVALELEQKKAALSNNLLKVASLNEFMASISAELEDSNNDFKPENATKVSRIIKKIKTKNDSSVWDEFEIRFEQIHNGFYDNLIERFPKLSPNEKRLCAFLKLNLSSKEISSLTGQSVHSIGVSRVRLRKRFNITNKEIGLTEFIESIGTSEK